VENNLRYLCDKKISLKLKEKLYPTSVKRQYCMVWSVWHLFNNQHDNQVRAAEMDDVVLDELYEYKGQN